jgi:uncharacterized protein (DUF302 family)
MASDLRTSVVEGTVQDAVTALQRALESRSIEVFAVIDHGASAQSAGLELGDEVVVIFGNPTVGTKLMQAEREVGLDLPLRILVWDDGGTTKATYSDPHAFASEYGLESSETILDGMSSLLAALVRELSTT